MRMKMGAKQNETMIRTTQEFKNNVGSKNDRRHSEGFVFLRVGLSETPEIKCTCMPEWQSQSRVQTHLTK